MAYLDLDHVHFTIPEGEEDRARAFYHSVLDFDEVPRPEPMRRDGGVWFRSGGVELHLGIESDFRPARRSHPGIRVDDLDRLAARCANAGYDVQWDSRYPGVRRFYVRDPFGNRIELMQPEAPDLE